MRIPVTFLISLLLLPLSACSGNSEDCTTREIDAIQICLGPEWRELSSSERKSLKLTEETIAAFSNGPVHLTVTREPLMETMDQLTYGEVNAKSVMSLPGYAEVTKEKVKTGAGKASLHIFQTGAQKFLQLSLLSDSVGYTVTAAMPVGGDEGVERELKQILERVSTKE